MRIPIAYCLGLAGAHRGPAPRLDLARAATLTFEEPDLVRFPALDLPVARSKQAARRRLYSTPPTRWQSASSCRADSILPGFRLWSRPHWRRRRAEIGRKHRKASMKHFLLTMIQDRWLANSCPKLPQRHPRRSARVRGSSGNRVDGFRFSVWDQHAGLGRARHADSVLFVLTVVVFFHELGHFLVARWYGVRVLVFSIGFGPEIFGFNDRHGTRWKLSAIPLGGYVKFFGDDNAASVPDQAATCRA